MTELERYLRAYITQRINEIQSDINTFRVSSQPLHNLYIKLAVYKEILDQLNLHKDRK